MFNTKQICIFFKLIGLLLPEINIFSLLKGKIQHKNATLERAPMHQKQVNSNRQTKQE